MTWQFFELGRKKIMLRTEEEFREKACGSCRFKEICEAWEATTLSTLYGHIEKDEVYRCAHWEHE